MSDGRSRPRPARLDPLPAGARDMLDGAPARRRGLRASLMGTFERWGFDEVIVPNLEYYDVLRRGLSEDERRRSVRFVEGGTGKLVTLRADMTPQVARLVAQRMAPRFMDARGKVREVFRVSYAGDVVRLPESARERPELHQVGVECIGDGDPTSDAELICLVHAALLEAGLTGFRIELAHRAVLGDAIATLGLDPSALREGLAGHLARKDGKGLSDALERIGVEDKLRRAFVSLVGAFGSPDAVLADARKSLRPLKVGRALSRLAEVVDLVASLDPSVAETLAVDLGEVRGFDYYTGLRIRVWARGVAEPIVRGGRYNDMVAKFGLDLPATGFAIDLDALERALDHARAEDAERMAGRDGYLIAVPKRAKRDVVTKATRLAIEARRAGRAWLEHHATLDAAKQAASRAQAGRMTWFGPRTVHYRRTKQGWSLEAGRPTKKRKKHA